MTTATTKKTTAPKKLRATKKKVASKTQAKTSKNARELAGRWQIQMKKYQKNLESLVGDLKKLDKESAKKLIQQAKTVGEHEWKKVRKNVEVPMEHFLKDLHSAKQNIIRDSEEMVKQMRARLRLLQKQVKKNLHKTKS
jgi:polyhydroxyalkanoate synthesis regulator phasin